MAEIRDGFLRTMDHENSGIYGPIKTFEELLKFVDEELHTHLVEQRVNPQFYSLRWLMLLMSQEFELCNVIRLWDTLFADIERFKFMNYVCVAMVLIRRPVLIQSDFSECMEALQRQTPSNSIDPNA